MDGTGATAIRQRLVQHTNQPGRREPDLPAESFVILESALHLPPRRTEPDGLLRDDDAGPKEWYTSLGLYGCWAGANASDAPWL